jgi:sarcosine oxidase
VKSFATIVLGLGAMGSAALYQLAKRGHRVLGIDRHSPPHAQGSTHGDTRITRLAIGEGAQYTPLVLRSHEIWRELEQATGTSLLIPCGGLIVSSRTKTSVVHVDDFFAKTIAAAEQYRIPHEILDAHEIRRRFPPLNVKDDEVGYFERDAGYLRVEECVRVQLRLAQRHGAVIHCHENVLGFEATATSVDVTTDQATYSADRLIVAAGPWLPQLIDDALARNFKVLRQVLFWFEIRGAADAFDPERFPVFIWELQGKAQGVYGFPAVDGPAGGLKVATETYGAATTPEAVDRTIGAEEIAAVYEEYVAPHISGLGSRCLRAVACLYTVTPDFGFVIDTHPHCDRIMIASACSGHGFKHSAAIGEALMQWAVDGGSRIDLRSCGFARFP